MFTLVYPVSEAKAKPMSPAFGTLRHRLNDGARIGLDGFAKFGRSASTIEDGIVTVARVQITMAFLPNGP